jgi:acyl-CoA synthetase (AMP-forming)/AMP-acid ligase II/acyl carrier protein
MRLVRLGGESATAADFTLFKRHFRDEAVLVHTIGASEIKIVADYVLTKHSAITGSMLPLGYPAEDTVLSIVRADGSASAPDEPGELVIHSPIVTPGYWNRPELNAARFGGGPNGSPNRFYRTRDLAYRDANGCLFYAGRTDFQVKIRGHIVEPQDVEASLGAITGVSECAVVAWDSADGEKYLAAYVVTSDGQDPSTESLRASLAERLPAYMLPSVWVHLEVMPRTLIGKLDRAALPEPVTDRAPGTAREAPRQGTEMLVAAVWEAVLETSPIGRDEEFLDLGGDSLKAARLLAQIEAVTRLRIPFDKFFDAPTVSAQAQLIETIRRAAMSPQRE